MRTYRKIDIYFMGDYLASTEQAETCKEACAKYLEALARKNSTLGGLTFLERCVLRWPRALRGRFSK